MWWRRAAVAFVVICIPWSMLTSEMYETANEQRVECMAAGGSWQEPEIKPWNLVEGRCQ